MSVGKKLFDVLFSPISLIVGDKVGHVISGVVFAAIGVATGNFGLVAFGLGMAASSFAPKPKANAANQSRLTVSLNPTEPRKIAFGGTTALATDMRYGAYTGTNQDHYDQVVCVASHQVNSIDEIWFDNQQAWTAGGGVTSAYSGYLTVTTRTLGTRANGIAIDGVWTANATLTGCAYIYLRYKLTGNSSKATSPFSSSIPSRFTVRGKGALLYDPRLDGTVAGGSGAQRANDQTTWTWSNTTSRNPALQLLFYLLGWKIQNPGTSAWKLAVGRGIPSSRIDLPSFITAANICEESVTLAAGGTEPRYRSDGVFSEGDDPSTILTNLLGSMNGTLRDSGGKISLVLFRNDLGSPVASFTEANILGNESWAQSPPFNQIFNIVRGRYTDPSDSALYQLSDFPEVPAAGQPSLSPDGIDRIDTVDYSNVQSAAQAQRLAKQRLQRNQYQGTYSADFDASALQVSLGDPVQLSHAGLGWVNKLFRVTGQSISATGVVKLVLVEENAAIYAWSAEDSAAVTPGAPTTYNPLNYPLVAGIVAATSTIYRQATDPAGANPVQDGDIWVDTSTTPNVTKGRISGTWQPAANLVTQGTDIGVANGATKNTIYRQSTSPASPIDGDLWVDTSVTPNVTRVRVSGAWQAGANYVTSGPDIGVAAGATAGRNMILNPGAETGAVAPWALDSTVIAVAGTGWVGTFTADATSPPEGKYRFALTKGATSQATVVMHPAIAVKPGEVWTFRGTLVGASATATGLYFRMNQSASSPASGYVGYTESGSWTNVTDLLLNGPVPAAATLYEYQYTVPAGVFFVSPAILAWVNSPSIFFDEIEFFRAADFATAVTGSTKPEASADITRILTVSPGLTVQYDYTGTTTTQLPATLHNKMVKSGVDVTASTSWTYTASGCTVSTSGMATGDVSLTAVTADNATINVSATIDGVTRTDFIAVPRKLGLAPAATSGSGTGAFPTSFSEDASATITSTSYATVNVLAASIQMQANSSGQIRAVLNCSYTVFGAGKSAAVNAKLQKSTDNGTWSDAGLSATGTTSTGSSSFDGGTDGSLQANSLVSSLGANANLYFRWIAIASMTGVSSVGVSGTASGAQS